MAKANLTKSADIQVAAREIDFVTRFENNWQHLIDILGIMKPIKKAPGSVLKSLKAELTLQDGKVGEGEDIPYSLAKIVEVPYGEVEIEKYAKATSIESIKNHGYDVAVAETDNEFLFQLQANVTDRFYKYLNTGTLVLSETTWQRCLAMAKGQVINRFKEMHKTCTKIVGFANVLDLYDYLGDKEVTTQTAFGFTYVKNFMGYDVIFLLSDNEIQRGRVIATPVENIKLYYVDPSDSDFARAGLVYRTSGQTNLIGFHCQPSYGNAVAETFAILGLTLFSEYIDAIAVADVDATPTLGKLTVGSANGTKTGDTKITVTEPKENPANIYKYKVEAGAAPTVAYAQNVRNWATWDGKSDITATTGHHITVVECDAAYKAMKSGSATVSAKA